MFINCSRREESSIISMSETWSIKHYRLWPIFTGRVTFTEISNHKIYFKSIILSNWQILDLPGRLGLNHLLPSMLLRGGIEHQKYWWEVATTTRLWICLLLEWSWLNYIQELRSFQDRLKRINSSVYYSWWEHLLKMSGRRGIDWQPKCFLNCQYTKELAWPKLSHKPLPLLWVLSKIFCKWLLRKGWLLNKLFSMNIFLWKAIRKIHKSFHSLSKILNQRRGG